MQAWLPFLVLLVVVAAWTGPWSPLPKISWFKTQAVACSALAATCPAKGNVTAVFNFAPYVGGSAILASWIIVAILLLAMGKLKGGQIGEVFRRTFHQMWGACLVGVFIFGLAYMFNYSGMAASLAKGFSSMGTAFIIVAPILGFIGVALSGSNTSTNAMFGKFQALVGTQLGMPLLLLPSLNSVGAEIGKPIAPQTASVGRLDQQVRAQGRRRHPPQHGLDVHPARLPDRHRGAVLLRAPGRDGAEAVNLQPPALRAGGCTQSQPSCARV